ncbi:Coronin-2B [Acipenser ruthenus]|uniref:Coronin-2B n=1 Tax=Acipenser ruthenus TaxID=7906 RepID=A0A444V0I3_ACIRT|nr:Coronin-2B [Acipenser ruthenus]
MNACGCGYPSPITGETGRIDPHYPKVCGHQGNVLDIKWNPFIDNIIASCSEDTSMSWCPQYRSSKFRNVYGKVANREHCFEGIPITKNVHDNHFCAVNAKFLAIVTESAGGGSFLVIPVEQWCAGSSDPTVTDRTVLGLS